VPAAYKNAGAGVATITSGGPCSPLNPPTVDAGDVLICHAFYGGSTAAPSTPTGFTLLSGPHDLSTPATNGRVWVFGKIAAGTEDGLAVQLGNQAVTTPRRARVYSFDGALNDVIANVVVGFAYATGTTAAISDTGVTTTGTDSLACQLVAVADDNAVDAFAGETGGNWLEPVAEFTDTTGTPDTCMQLQTAAMPTAGTINGGSFTMAAADPWGVIGFYIKAGAAGTPVGKDLQAIWHANQAVGDTTQLIWHINQAVGDPLQFVWNTNLAVGDPLQLVWNANATVGKANQFIWNVNAAVGKSDQFVWHVRTAVGDPLQLIWNVSALGTAVGKELQFIWNVRAAIGDPLALQWNSLQAVGDPLALQWHVLTSVGDSIVLLWNARQAVGDQLQLVWHVEVTVTVSGGIILYLDGLIPTYHQLDSITDTYLGGLAPKYHELDSVVETHLAGWVSDREFRAWAGA
jgi:hypothetical protein